ncbi:hypothetical protein ABH931_002762 [Streptacidiphilus sp. MAP12-33]|uniref:hypothetical protein n=1 Tax=Streptacidiphilus sp. MAP12-33 TaxID=3156266 RepID=UPI003516901B
MKRRHLLPLATAVTTSALAAASVLPLAATASADTNPPLMQDMGYLKTDHGYVLRGLATGDISEVVFELAAEQAGVVTRYQVTASQQATDGSWQTAGPINVPPNVYGLSAWAVAPDGTKSLLMVSGVSLPFLPHPEFHDTTAAPSQLSLATPDFSTSGHLTTYDPNRGDLGTAWTGGGTIDITNGSYTGDTTSYPIAADGSFHATRATGYIGDGPGSQTFTMQASYTSDGITATEPGPTTTVPEAAPLPTRIILDRPEATGLTAGTTVDVTGTIQYQDATGWHPLPDSSLFAGTNGNYYDPNTTTDADGRFTDHLTVPTAATTWNLLAEHSYVDTSSATFSVSSIQQAVTLHLGAASVDEHSNLTIHPSIHSTNGVVPTGHAQLQQSTDGKTGWTTIAQIPATWTIWTGHVTNPHGYWRLYSPASTGYHPALSNTVHTSRYLAALTGGTPPTTTAHHGQTLTFTGGLWEENPNGWHRVSGEQVRLMFRAAGSTTWHTAAVEITGLGGYYTLTGTANVSGTWQVTYPTLDPNHTQAAGPATYVHVN